MEMHVATDRLRKLVADNLQGAELRQVYPTETNDVEVAFVILWRRGGTQAEEYGTHRACLSQRGDDGMLVWGHYFRGPRAIVDAYKDYNNRIGKDE